MEGAPECPVVMYCGEFVPSDSTSSPSHTGKIILIALEGAMKVIQGEERIRQTLHGLNDRAPHPYGCT